jgi:hypothetical protein
MISVVPQALGRRQDDFGALSILLRRVAIARNRVKLTAIRRLDVHHNSSSHDESMKRFWKRKAKAKRSELRLLFQRLRWRSRQVSKHR